jgi:hypothetical protein
MTRFGWSGLNQALNSNTNNNFNTNNASNIGDLITPVRVLSIVLDDTHPRFKELGGWNALGVIEYELIINPNTKVTQFPTAYPLNPSVKNYPLINETAYIISLPDTDIGETNVSQKSYYVNIIGMWNHPHHNAYPTTPNTPSPSQQKDYVQTQAGSVRRVTDNSTEIFLGNTFKERANIHPLLPFEGDVIHEGRWGNSIRLGSTVKNTPNNWSNVETNGDPITIIRNGQGSQTNEGWIPITEDINNDDTSIYLTSTQQIPLEVSSDSYVSYPNNPPTNPNEYNGKQIILNSGRLIFNSNDDHILLSSAKSINLNSKESVNIDTPSFIIQSNEMYLGSNEATEPLLLGNATVDLLRTLILELESVATALQSLTSTPAVLGAPVTFPTLLAPSTKLKVQCGILKNKLNTLTSKRNFTV